MGIKDEILRTVSSGGMYGGSATAVYGGFTANEIAAFGGLFIAVLGFAYNVWHSTQLRRIARERNEE